ncbi:TetR/AcrR family transcriptional regulator [Kribbella sandramycini]|uniref:AcrR family transcriptional regulator n=1 Tax=Kribbella sandramycini TaxID=60450 RepID=A0A7Y4KZL0_9ACTN|nr:TetR/AcrR family transcriptional regulator [Kribbella sandramycini]MBB6569397.1 AcrR family transcriptional regulator [Kribbella sandramycini]NOL40766.1 TetR/AcrR family transcriptional regulator [Kribbella sandramycini]
MTQTSSARLRPGERRAQILEAARRVLLADPHRELTVELVAAEAKVSPALLFHYFGSKKKFQYAVIEEAAAEILLRTAPDQSLPPAEQLQAGIRAFVRAVLEAPQLYRATLLMSAAGDPEVRKLHKEIRGVFSTWVIGAVRERGLEITPVVELALHGWQGYVEQTLLTWIEEPTISPADLEHLCARSLDAIVSTTQR